MPAKPRYRILCVNCRKPLYLYNGDFQGAFDMNNFRPITSDVPAPAPGEAMMCVRCGNPWYLLNRRGSIFVLTDEGLKPRAPTGTPRVFVPDEVGYVLPELPPGYGEDQEEFQEPR